MRLLICLLLLSSCCAKTDKNPVNEPVAEVIANPLDSILGEKILSENPLKIRPDNFNDLIGMPASLLSDSSALYDIERLDSTIWVMQHRKHYLKSREYALLVKTDGKKIVQYKALNDYRIGYHLVVSGGFVFTSGVSGLRPFPGVQYDHYVRIFKMDSDLNEVWTYTPQPKYALRATGLRKQGSHYIIPFDAIVSSTEVYHVVRVELDENGKYVSGRQTTSVNCNDTLSLETINSVFSNRR